ncbi:Hypothetical protein SCLAV_1696 [Streptomyces clavuligerus]|uniref:LigA protein n=1 Tax=Streptomyces clavuligerus TaxID=1901 RepID=E2Q318_STRCL|nr:Hypothetical protein SCLAV_1696 [Streptomyces clavuligerus]
MTGPRPTPRGEEESRAVLTQRTPTTQTTGRKAKGLRWPVLTAVLTAGAIASGGLLTADIGADRPASTAPVAAAAPLAADGPWRATAVPVKKGDLTAVDGLDAANVWAVGYRLIGLSGGEPVALRWNGTSWREESKLPTGLWPQALSVRSANDIWAAGAQTAHWNGTSWTHHTLAADPAGQVTPDALDTAPDGSVWVAGRAITSPGSIKVAAPAVQRWNGTAWQRQPLPDVGAGELSAVKAVAADNVWAVGASFAPEGGKQSALALHWNGSSWKRATLPAARAGEHRWFNGVTATRSGEIWAVGATVAADGTERPYTARWDGRTWTEPKTPAVADGRLRSVTETSDGALWAGGGKGAASLLLRWDAANRRWEKAADPGLTVRSITSVPGSRTLWTVGVATSGDMLPTAARLPR